MNTRRFSYPLFFCIAIATSYSCYAMTDGTITFRGMVVAPAPTAMVGTDGSVQTRTPGTSARVRSESLSAARAALPDVAVLDYFARYARPGSELATVVYN